MMYLKEIEEAAVKAQNSLRKANNEFTPANYQSSLLARVLPLSSAIGEKQNALEKNLPYIKQAQKDLDYYLKLVHEAFPNTLLLITDTLKVNFVEISNNVLCQTTDLMYIFHAMNEMNDNLWRLSQEIDCSLIEIKRTLKNEN